MIKPAAVLTVVAALALIAGACALGLVPSAVPDTLPDTPAANADFPRQLDCGSPWSPQYATAEATALNIPQYAEQLCLDAHGIRRDLSIVGIYFGVAILAAMALISVAVSWMRHGGRPSPAVLPATEPLGMWTDWSSNGAPATVVVEQNTAAVPQ